MSSDFKTEEEWEQLDVDEVCVAHNIAPHSVAFAEAVLGGNVTSRSCIKRFCTDSAMHIAALREIARAIRNY